MRNALLLVTAITVALALSGLARVANATTTFRITVIDTGYVPCPAAPGNTPKEGLQWCFAALGEIVPFYRLIITDTQVCNSTHRIRAASTGRVTFGYDTLHPHRPPRPGCP